MCADQPTADQSADDRKTGRRAPAAGKLDLAAALNPAQLEAATAGKGAYLVVAGAGSGKTRTLTHRVAHLVESGTRPESILLLTFTRRASQEMLRRASNLLDERCRRVAGGTYHAFANLVLRRHAALLGYGESFTILDRSDAGDLIALLRTEGGYDRRGRRFPRKDTLLDLYSRVVNTGRELEDLLEEGAPQFLDDLEAIEELRGKYIERKKTQNVMDYDDLLVNLRVLLAEHDEVRRKISRAHKWVMVDEYQDTNRLQAHISALLASAHGNIMVVGDDAQSIYSFRGADFRNIMDFPRLFPDCKTIVLEQNYRSIQPVLDLGNAVLEQAREKYSKRLFSDIPGDEKPLLLRAWDGFEQADWICRRILALREEGVALGEIAVLARAAWHTNALEIELQNRNIPFRKFGGIKFVESAHVKDVCALLKISANPLDGAAWMRVLQLLEGIGAKTAQGIAGEVIAAGGDLAPLRPAEGRRKRKFDADLALLAELLESASEARRTVSERLDAVLDQYTEWMPKKYDDTARRLRDLEALELVAERYDDIESFLTDIAIDPPEFARPGSAVDEDDEWVTLSTVHSAKGLEWHTVFVVQLNLGQFPGFASLQNEASYEEERRLFYVAVTRAKRNLYLIKPEQMSGRGYGSGIGEMSPLLTDIPNFRELLVEERYVPPTGDADLDDEDDGAESPELLGRIQDYFSD